MNELIGGLGTHALCGDGKLGNVLFAKTGRVDASRMANVGTCDMLFVGVVLALDKELFGVNL